MGNADSSHLSEGSENQYMKQHDAVQTSPTNSPCTAAMQNNHVDCIMIANNTASECYEVPLSREGGTLYLSTLRRIFKDATGLKYRNPATGLERVLQMNNEETCFLAPEDGWKNKLFTVVRPKTFRHKSFKKRRFQRSNNMESNEQKASTIAAEIAQGDNVSTDLKAL